MSWKKRNQKLRGPRISNKVRTLRIYPNPGGEGFYADPAHKLRIFKENGAWYYQSLDNNDGVRFKIYDPKDSWALPCPPVWSGSLLMMSIMRRETITNGSQIRSRYRAYKAATDAMSSSNIKPSHMFINGKWRPL